VVEQEAIHFVPGETLPDRVRLGRIDFLAEIIPLSFLRIVGSFSIGGPVLLTLSIDGPPKVSFPRLIRTVTVVSFCLFDSGWSL
jgi:hypothetical protein